MSIYEPNVAMGITMARLKKLVLKGIYDYEIKDSKKSMWAERDSCSFGPGRVHNQRETKSRQFDCWGRSDCRTI